MAIALKSCERCRGPLELGSIEKVSAENGPLKMTIHGMPAAKCAKGHAAPVHQDFLLWLLHGVRDRVVSLLPAAEAKGLLFRKYLCACGRELSAGAEQRRGFAFDLAFEGAPEFKVELEMPVYRCEGCGKSLLRSPDELRKAASTGMVDICDRAGFPHSG